MKHPSNLYSRLSLIASITLVVGYFIVQAATLYYTDLPNVASGSGLTATSWNNLVNYANKAIKQDTEILTVTGGKVGIGTTTPNALFHAFQTTGNNAEIDIQSVVGANNHWGIYNDRTDNSLKFWNNSITGEKNAVTVLSNGNVGIGTPSPGYKLTLQDGTFGIGDTAQGSAAAFSYSAGKLQIWLDSAGTDGIYFRTYSGGYGDRMVIKNTGNVGIGTTSPQAKLTTTGDILFAGTPSVGSYGMIKAVYNGSADLYGSAASIEFYRPVSMWGNEGEIRFSTHPGAPGVQTPIQRMVINKDGIITMNSLAGTYTNSSAFVCVNNSGQLYTSEVACP